MAVDLGRAGAAALARLSALVNRSPRLDERLRGDQSGRGWRPARLTPGEGTSRLSETGFEASTASPWLCLDLGGPVPAGRWIRLRYGAGLLGDPVRPVLRLHRAGGDWRDVFMPGPVCGWAIWTGRLPDDCVGLAVCPVARPGPFAFAIGGSRTLSRAALLIGGLQRTSGQTLVASKERLLGRRTRARHMMAAIWSATPLSRYRAWLAAREAGPRLPEPWTAERSTTLRVALVVDARGRDADELQRTLVSIDGQEGVAARVVVLAAHDPGDVGGHAIAGTAAEAFALAVEGADWVGVVAAGDRLAPTGLAAFGEAIARDPDTYLVYCDEDRIDLADERSDPVFKPDWSPRLQASAPYLGGLALVRSRHVEPDRIADADDLPERLAGLALASGGGRVVHVRRILLHRSPAVPHRLAAPAKPAEARRPAVSAIIPNRDRLHLLQPCIEGLRGGTDYSDLEIVIVDNGSEAAETRAFYASLAADPRVSILDRPGPFNYSALTNAGVTASRGELLLLLNNDIEVVRPDWLTLLVGEAAPDVGAVGAKLLYPSGRVQHEGVVIGLGGGAGHIQRNRPEAGPDSPARRRFPHEVSAVTGACLLVARDKYEAVGGLDETRFPVSYNDIDLCLKLRQAGWRNILAPGAVLIHHESASRGRDDRGEKQARAEREAHLFAESWPDVMRDDPYYHPAFSLLRFEPSLG